MVIDSSSLISLAWSGALPLLEHSPIPLRVPREVRREIVDDAGAAGHADAHAIASAISTLAEAEADPTLRGDAAVLDAASLDGALLSNDLALGRRARNFGVHWLRTADFVTLCVAAGHLSRTDGAATLTGLATAGRITQELLGAYLKELP